MTNRVTRILKHRWVDEADTRRAIPPALVDKLAQCVADSERRHTGEIRIYVESGLPLSYLWRKATPRERAVAMFGKLGVWDTEQNNGVLIYLLLAEHRIEVVADRGLDRHVPDEQWTMLVSSMAVQFRAGCFEAGLLRAIDIVDRVLVEHFPAPPDKVNPDELPNAPVLD